MCDSSWNCTDCDWENEGGTECIMCHTKKEPNSERDAPAPKQTDQNKSQKVVCSNLHCTSISPSGKFGTSSTWLEGWSSVPLCYDCWLMYSWGNYCPYCSQIYFDAIEPGGEREVGGSWISCDDCSRWVHTLCEAVAQGAPPDPYANYFCPQCQQMKANQASCCENENKYYCNECTKCLPDFVKLDSCDHIYCYTCSVKLFSEEGRRACPKCCSLVKVLIRTGRPGIPDYTLPLPEKIFDYFGVLEEQVEPCCLSIPLSKTKSPIPKFEYGTIRNHDFKEEGEFEEPDDPGDEDFSLYVKPGTGVNFFREQLEDGTEKPGKCCQRRSKRIEGQCYSTKMQQEYVKVSQMRKRKREESEDYVGKKSEEFTGHFVTTKYVPQVDNVPKMANGSRKRKREVSEGDYADTFDNAPKMANGSRKRKRDVEEGDYADTLGEIDVEGTVKMYIEPSVGKVEERDLKIAGRRTLKVEAPTYRRGKQEIAQQRQGTNEEKTRVTTMKRPESLRTIQRSVPTTPSTSVVSPTVPGSPVITATTPPGIVLQTWRLQALARQQELALQEQALARQQAQHRQELSWMASGSTLPITSTPGPTPPTPLEDAPEEAPQPLFSEDTLQGFT